MPVKESSDELNPPVRVSSGFISQQQKRTPLDTLALTLATCGVGYLPLAPGTWGSLVGVGFYLLLRAASSGWSVPQLESLRLTLMLLALMALIIAGIWAASRAERLMGRKDPGAVVIDEIAGQLMTFLFVPFDASLWFIVTGFLAFRVFDIWKPYPARRLESLEGGLGIMADDVLAGAYAATLMSLLVSIHLLL